MTAGRRTCGATYKWIASSGGDFDLPSNWDGNVVPSTLDGGIFDSGRGMVSGNGAVGILVTRGGSLYTFTGTLTAQLFAIDGTTTLAGPGVWTSASGGIGGDNSGTVVGVSTLGILNIVNGAMAKFSSFNPYRAALTLGQGGTSAVTISNGSSLVAD